MKEEKRRNPKLSKIKDSLRSIPNKDLEGLQLSPRPIPVTV
jgi:hypothetical protein